MLIVLAIRRLGLQAEIALWRLSRDNTLKVATLALDVNGRFAINTSDNLVLVHHQSSKSTVVFDLKWLNTSQKDQPAQSDGDMMSIHRPIIHPFSITMKKEPADGPKSDMAEYDLCESPSAIPCDRQSSLSCAMPSALPMSVVSGIG